jgi:transposase
MNLSYDTLEKNELITLLQQKEERIASLELSNLFLKSELDKIKRMLFGSKSERFVPEVNPLQATLPFEEEIKLAEKPVPQEIISYTRDKKKNSEHIPTGRLPLPKHLERIPIIIEPQEDVTGLKKIGEEITEELEYVTGKFIVKQYIRPKYVKQDGEGILIGTLPSRPIDKGIPGPGLVAKVIHDKYVMHLPLYRQMQSYESLEVKLALSTLTNWVSGGCNLLEPLYNNLYQQVLSQIYLQADETPIKVLDKDKKGTTHRGYYWVYHAPLLKMVVFDYRQGRGREGPREFLKNFSGFLQTDGYAVYDILDNKKITLLGCMAHARRKFEEALSNDRIRVEYVLKLIQQLYDIERRAREQALDAEQRKALRQKESIPVLDDLYNWLQENVMQVLPQSAIGTAIAYSLSRWDKLKLYTQDGRLEIDNNLVENSIRPVAIGRKNYLFAGSHEGARRAAMIYSLLGTCKKNNVDPYVWLRDVLARLPDHKANQLYQLLPNNWVPLK